MILSETRKYDCISFVKSIFDDSNLYYIWTEHFVENSNWLSRAIKLILESQGKHECHGLPQNSSKCLNYRFYKTEHKFENYLNQLPHKVYCESLLILGFAKIGYLTK